MRQTKEISATSLEALSSEMRNSGDFVQADISELRNQAALIPAVTLSDSALAEITSIFTRFYTEPSLSTYTAVLEAYRVLDQALLNTRNTKYTHVSVCYQVLLSTLNTALAQRIFIDERALRSITLLTREQQVRIVGLR